MPRAPRRSPLPVLPADHRPAMRVPAGGASCANCRFYRRDGGPYGRCVERNFGAYYGTQQIPCPPDAFCSDWYEPGVRLPPC